MNKATIRLIDNGVLDPKPYKAKLKLDVDGGDVWEYKVRRGDTRTLVTDKSAYRVKSGQGWFFIVMDGDLLPCDWLRSKYGFSFLPEVVRGALVKASVDAVKPGGGLPKWLLIAGGIVIVGVAIFFFMTNGGDKEAVETAMRFIQATGSAV